MTSREYPVTLDKPDYGSTGADVIVSIFGRQVPAVVQYRQGTDVFVTVGSLGGVTAVVKLAEIVKVGGEAT